MRPPAVSCRLLAASLLSATLAAPLLAGCASVPELPSFERFEIACKVNPSKPNEVLIPIHATFASPIETAKALHVTSDIKEGVVEIEILGWQGKGMPGEAVVVVGLKPGLPFDFAINYKGHRDLYRVPPFDTTKLGDVPFEPQAGEFTAKSP